MNKEFTRDFIEVYRQNPSLWKVKSRDYVNKHLKNAGIEALLEVCQNYSMTADANIVKKKIQSLRGAFRKEYQKVQKSIRSGVRDDQIYKPTLWYYDLLLFTKDQNEPTDDNFNYENIDSIEEIDDEGDEAADQISNSDGIIAGTVLEVEQTPKEKTNVNSSFSSYATDRRMIMKRRRFDLARKQSIFSQACTKAVTNEDDPFGIYIGKKLKTIKCEKQKMIAETLITNVLQKAVFNKLTENTVLTEAFTSYPSINSSLDNAISENK